MTKMTDGEIMVMLRNTALMLEDIAKTTGQRNNVTAAEDGYVNVKIGGYEFCGITSQKYGRVEEYWHYRLGNGTYKWTKVTPQQIRFGQEPVEKALTLEEAVGATTNNTRSL